jgi:hypothetical protein
VTVGVVDWPVRKPGSDEAEAESDKQKVSKIIISKSFIMEALSDDAT